MEKKITVSDVKCTIEDALYASMGKLMSRYGISWDTNLDYFLDLDKYERGLDLLAVSIAEGLKDARAFENAPKE